MSNRRATHVPGPRRRHVLHWHSPRVIVTTLSLYLVLIALALVILHEIH